MIYVLDTNVISDTIKQRGNVSATLKQKLALGERLILCQPVVYEIQRGFLWRNATAQMKSFNQQLKPLFEWADVTRADWDLAAQYWAQTVAQGR